MDSSLRFAQFRMTIPIFTIALIHWITMTKTKLFFTLLGYGFLVYVCALLPFHLYEPSARFDLPTILWLIHLITLYIHEAGHLIFFIFGRTMGLLGGSLLQIIVPVVWFLLARREESGLMPVALFFTGESIADVSIYVKDAAARILPLLGGGKVRHDWGTLLGDAGMIEWGVPLGTGLFFAGMILCILAIVWGVTRSLRQYNAFVLAPAAESDV
jgi:hypothetical protein